MNSLESLENLTDVGRFRQYRIGLELRRQYSKYLGYDSSRILAFSSPLYRCIESLELILQGLYNIDWPMGRGIHAALEKDCVHCLPSGSGSALEWRSVGINTTFLPALFYGFLNSCKYRKEHPSPVDQDLTRSEDISALVGLEKLAEVLLQHYKQPMSLSALGLWSTIGSELNLVRTRSTMKYADHYSDWINTVVSKRGDQSINLFDLYEQMSVFGYRDRVVGLANYVQTGPILTSIVESQLVALRGVASSERQQVYKNKKLIIYSSHDSILQLVLHTLKVIDADGESFEDRFYHWAYSGDQLGQFLAGLKMSSFGFSMKFELFEMELESKPGTSFAHVQLSIYNQEDGKYTPIDYRLVALGDACQRLFFFKYPEAGQADLQHFYDSYFPIDKTYSCPFELFRNVTSEFMIENHKLEQICAFNESNSNKTKP